MAELPAVNRTVVGSSPTFPSSTPLGLLGKRSLALSDCFQPDYETYPLLVGWIVTNHASKDAVSALANIGS